MEITMCKALITETILCFLVYVRYISRQSERSSLKHWRAYFVHTRQIYLIDIYLSLEK